MAGSATSRAASAPRQEGAQPWIDLAVGCPDWEPPRACIESAAAACGPRVPYRTPGGDPDLRQRLVEESAWNAGGGDIDCVLTTGGKEALFLGLGAILVPGDVVLVCAPYWPSFLEQIRAWGGVPHVIPEGRDGLPQLHALASAAPRAKAIIVNTPSNPSGRIWPTARWQELSKLAHREDLWVVLDAVYGGLAYSERSCVQNGLPTALLARTLVVDSGSKSYSLPGLRIGWATGPARWIQAMRSLQDASSTHPSLAGQAALRAALDIDPDWSSGVRARLQQRAEALWKAVQASKSLTMRLPEGGLFGLIELPAGTDDRDFVRRLAEEQQVAVIAGSAFGAPTTLRAALTVDPEGLREAVRRIECVVERPS
ncbi:Aspartate aminotransferase [Planctomycetes bacterium Poly30]|uniref:Aspartate aminotransferase n=2 Tax=Saltatorellus ferox TaxID=2528018 RepID=A0A518EPE9_9BACT|nr:Aspartate aminotransferase [Planctomycetes bacterium Poly30]